DVTSEVGIVGNASNGTLNEIRVSVAGAAGSDQIDLSETTIEAVGPNGQENLVFNGTDSVDNLTANQFGVKDDNGNFVSSDNAVLDEDSQM
ncbi:flagellin, partial [Halorubrum sp. SP3]